MTRIASQSNRVPARDPRSVLRDDFRTDWSESVKTRARAVTHDVLERARPAGPRVGAPPTPTCCCNDVERAQLAEALGTAAAAKATNVVRRGIERVPPVAPPVHLVVPGDTLSAIAAANGVTFDALLAVNPQITNPDLIYPGDVVVLPSAQVPSSPSSPSSPTPSDPATTPPEDGLPMNAAQADPFHLTQYVDPTYNPTGPNFSANCGPASLAITLDVLGQMPAGLTPEQRVDYARSLMNPGVSPSSTVRAADGSEVPQLDTDHAYSNVEQLTTAASSLGVPAASTAGWDALDAALASGQPVVANGDAYQGWREQFAAFPGHYGSGDVGHFNTILGKTPDGKYIVSDPMFTGGPVEMTREQLSAFFAPSYGGEPHFLVLG